jgi:signal transduction histidine kinase
MRYINTMRPSDSPFLSDWFAVSLRWMLLLGLSVSTALAGRLLEPAMLVLAGMVLWNVLLTLLAGLNLRMPFHRLIGTGMDLLFAGLAFMVSGGFYSPACWIGLMPVISAALYYQWQGALVAAAVMTVLEAVFTSLQASTPWALLFPAGSGIFLFMAAGGFGVVCSRLAGYISNQHRMHVEDEKKKLGMENERIRAIYNLTSTLMGTLNYQRVLDSVLDLSLSALASGKEAESSDRLTSAVLLFKQDMLQVGSGRRLTPADQRVTIHGQSGAIAAAIEENKSILVQDVTHDPELAHFASFLACQEVYCFPLRSGFNAYGVLLFGYPAAGYFTPDRCEVLEILGRQAVVAIQNARLYQDLVDEHARMLEVQEEARKKLARDLHDGPTQSVSALAMRINMVQHMLTRDPGAAGEELVHIEELARRTTKEIRHMLFTLRPLVLETQGLVAALNSMAEKMKETYSQDVLVEVDPTILSNMEMGKQSVIFYLVEEAVTNARKHAHSNHIWVNLHLVEKSIALLEVRDDGSGFDVAAVMRAYDQRGSLGMVNLRERTELVNGVLNVESTTGRGTRVQVYIPLDEEAADRLQHGVNQH